MHPGDHPRGWLHLNDNWLTFLLTLRYIVLNVVDSALHCVKIGDIKAQDTLGSCEPLRYAEQVRSGLAMVQDC